MKRTTITVLVAVSTVLGLAVIIFAAYASHLSLQLPEPRPGIHVPCLASQPHCDIPFKGIWTTP